MRIRITIAVVVAALAFTAVGCSGSDSDSGSGSKAGATTSAPAADSATKDAGLPPEPTGAERAAVLAVLFDVGGGGLTGDEDKAIDASRKQCAALDSGVADPDHAAAQQFSYDGRTLTDDDGKHINIGLRKTLCPES
ncbi:hypothetical protein [Streptomyces sp. NPDC048623]|uniref:hypothetical protein n=1 Tax=Streptomyces sp. NPDC048623 TaxID=3155761 RepID=UPI00343C236D